MRVLLLGDTHGDTGDAMAHVKLASLKGCDVIVQLGDFGFMGQGVDQFVHKLNRVLLAQGLQWWWVDGNHDNHQRLAHLRLTPDGRHITASEIFHLPRGYRWSWDGVSFMACGGAYSIDKSGRKEGVSWWPEETISEGDVIRCGDRAVDVLVCHDVPWGVADPYGPGTGGGDKDLWPQSTANRRALRAIVDRVRPRLVVHGHTHHRKSTDMCLDDGTQVRVEGFSRNGMEGHYGIINLEQWKNG